MDPCEQALERLAETLAAIEAVKVAYGLDGEAFDVDEAYDLLETWRARLPLDHVDRATLGERACAAHVTLEAQQSRLAIGHARKLLWRHEAAVETAVGCALAEGKALESLAVVMRDGNTPFVPPWLREKPAVSLFEATDLAPLLSSIAAETSEKLRVRADQGTHYVVALCFGRVQLCARELWRPGA